MLTKWIILLSCIPVFATSIFAAFVYQKLRREYQVFSWFLFVSGTVQLISVTLWWFNKNNMPLLHFYVAAGFFCLALFYKTVLRKLINPLFFWVAMVLFLAFTLINSLFVQSIFTFDSNGLTVEAVFVMIFSLSTLLLSQNEILKSNRQMVSAGLKWINSGLFLFYASSSLLYYFGDTITRFFPVYLSRYSWTLHSFFSVIMYSCFFVGLWKSRTK